MDIELFAMERFQSLWENVVDYNLSESGVHPLNLKELLHASEFEQISTIALGYNQTNGSEALRTTIAKLYSGATAANVLVTSGSAEANFLISWALLQPGDEVALMLPNYMQLWGLARSFGSRVKVFHLMPKDGRWQIDWDELDQAITPKTKLIAICNPNNPTGAQLNQNEIMRICELARKTDAWILADEVYRGAERDYQLTPSFWGRSDKVLAVAGLSKAYGLPGLRIGWIVGPAQLIEKIWSYHDYTTICANPISDFLATVALSSPNRERILERTRNIINHNYAVLEHWLKSYADIFEWIPPLAGAIALVKYAIDIKSVELVTRLRQQHSVLVVPGEHFLMENHLRFGFGSPADYLSNALDRISKFLSKI
ncbi:MAG: aminotransferase class I/II-fold pyridoxal phosphate-dependent enzyme [candidate division KSB1 bacterium]|nr:aminotransferase class I/II-fold pyridoxal phosphate-dependent enzyme [candidate division KSB1 bacterium]MDZ7335580.1 aminotransferase class I/II-fold pyridoxal phosphate-dependent enzyme [candidate division KSB1 bacterium]MDZ7356452.1 aminotransferase class I/II-fold pyridoxal phosphate-dependent enzyme [candidate division KSB1 bacterium]MDZ7375842.1 aminotransferase class I/II-fold pyridoxal phosphate-dependent enzyme [candidate division KSB1 bacterium]MDZ7401223.1 aminotransferase class I